MQFDRQTLSIAMRFLMAKTPEQRAAVDLDTHYTQLRFHSFIPYDMMMMLILSIIQSYIQFEPHPMYLCRNVSSPHFHFHFVIDSIVNPPAVDWLGLPVQFWALSLHFYLTVSSTSTRNRASFLSLLRCTMLERRQQLYCSLKVIVLLVTSISYYQTKGNRHQILAAHQRRRFRSIRGHDIGERFRGHVCSDVLQGGNVWFCPFIQRARSCFSGFINLLKKEDSIVRTYRDHVHALSKGVPARAMMSELFGKKTGCYCGQGGSMHMFSTEHNVLGGLAFIGEGILVATGASFSSKYRREVLKEADCDHVTLAFFGDGTCNDGQFFECLNMAALWKLPIIFVWRTICGQLGCPICVQLQI
ncbi:unnamed protein product [Lactuca saligna]|uniref:Dehydrogenase E1 component domain-containing protein n=1 Tax=Lactuca saligna TaxID=75948 RepID=A0AA35Z5V1_LACSI|nr:unnamed protein product [Lactuca saligna]